jgi:hypothetical protein
MGHGTPKATWQTGLSFPFVSPVLLTAGFDYVLGVLDHQH